MLKVLLRNALFAVVLLPSMAAAEPIKLKLAFFTSDRSTSYFAAVKPFVEAVNAEARGLLEIQTYFSGALGKEVARQPLIVLDGTADIAYVVPGITPQLFPDNAIIEMPGLFRDKYESSVVFTRLTAANALEGYENYFVIGAFTTDPETIHSRAPITSLNDLKGKKIRVNNPRQAAALQRFGATPILMPVNQIAEAISSGAIDGATVPPSPLVDYGIKRVATYHYLLGINGAPLMVLMNRKTFDGLPASLQAILRKHSGEWAVKRFVDIYEVAESQIMEELKSDPGRKVTVPSQPDLDAARRVFSSVKDEWAAKSPHNRELLNKAELEIAKLRGTR
jgi:TRAP-type C4-dicarboxylate transport system substrate-binding protein